MRKRFLVLIIALIASVTICIPAFADAVDTEPYLALGADLTEEELATVLAIFDIEESELEDYNIVYITNEDEHEYLGEYFSNSVIGDRALSCVLVIAAEEGTGIGVETTNISYCTASMYENALVTAGVDDAVVSVAGPFSISGTAALVGAVMAYSEITNTDVDDDAVDAAIEEIVVTSELKDSTDSEEEIEGIIAYIKEAVVEEELTEEDLEEVLDEAEELFNVELSEEDRELIKGLVDTLQDIDLDLEAVSNQAQSIYEKLADNGYDVNLDSIIDSQGFFKNLKEKFVNFFTFKWIRDTDGNNNEETSEDSSATSIASEEAEEEIEEETGYAETIPETAAEDEDDASVSNESAEETYDSIEYEMSTEEDDTINFLQKIKNFLRNIFED